MKTILFTVTGILFYQTIGWLVAASPLFSFFCRAVGNEHICYTAGVVILIISLATILSGLYFRESYRVGKWWFWLKIVPAWRTA
jgi:hypothetical protein